MSLIINRKKALVGMTLLSLPASIFLSSCKLNNFVEIATIQKRSSLELKDDYKSGKHPKAIMIATNSILLDRSLNHSTYQGFRTAFEQLGLDINQTIHLEIDNAKQNYQSLYKIALENDFRVWILPGYQQGEQLTSFINANKNDPKISNIKFIGIDFDIGNDFPKEYKNNFYSYQFDVKQSAFMIGYGAAKYLSNKITDKKKRNLSMFGGGPFPGVTDFIRGYLAGALAFNLKETNPEKRVGVLSSSRIALNSGFYLGPTMNSAATNAVSENASMIFPVAGSATGVCLNKMKPGQLIVGVDVDQSLIFSKRKEHLFFSSTIKNIAQAAYNGLVNIYAKPDSNSSSKKSSYTDEHKIYGSFEQNLVGYSEAKFTDNNDKKNANDALEEGKKFFQEDKTKTMAKFLLQSDTYFNSDIQQHVDDLAQAVQKVYDSNEVADNNGSTQNATDDTTEKLLKKFNINTITKNSATT